MSVLDWVSGRVFNLVHRHNLVYNTCWEDPRLDRVALELSPRDNVLVITSAGCNALDYALCEPRHIYAVDVNPRQNALLELKMAGIRRLEFDDFFLLFGQGRAAGAGRIYRDRLRADLSPYAQGYWDKWIERFFDNPGRPFYYRGASGAFARCIRTYLEKVLRLRPQIDALLSASSLDEQREIFDRELRRRIWTRSIRFAMGRDTTLSMLGVPKSQRRQIDRQYPGGLVQFVHDRVEMVFARIPLADNYFWRVYMTGAYARDCCPEYLKEENFNRLKNGLVDRISTHTDSVQGFLESQAVEISRFVLLDHMDWLCDKDFPLLEAEWQAILARASSQARLLWRSGGLRTDYLNDVRLRHNGDSLPLPELLTYQTELAARLHAQDRVHTYGSFYIADLKGSGESGEVRS